MTPLASKIKENSIGHRIQKIDYSEINNPKGDFYFRGFHTFDYGMFITMSNGYQWHIIWKNDQSFTIGENIAEKKSIYTDNSKIWDATSEWESYLDHEILGVDLQFLGDDGQSFSECTLSFINGESITILIDKELNINNIIPKPLNYQDNGEIYIFFDQNLLVKSRSSATIKQNIVSSYE